MTHLVKLDLSKNRLQHLPSDIGRLTNLQHLDLLNNRLATLPVSFAQLKVILFFCNFWIGFSLGYIGDIFFLSLSRNKGAFSVSVLTVLCSKTLKAALIGMLPKSKTENDDHDLGLVLNAFPF